MWFDPTLRVPASRKRLRLCAVLFAVVANTACSAAETPHAPEPVAPATTQRRSLADAGLFIAQLVDAAVMRELFPDNWMGHELGLRPTVWDMGTMPVVDGRGGIVKAGGPNALNHPPPHSARAMMMIRGGHVYMIDMPHSEELNRRVAAARERDFARMTGRP